MPRADKAIFIQEMLSELSRQRPLPAIPESAYSDGAKPLPVHRQQAQMPEPDSRDWWRAVAQGLGVKARQAELERDALVDAFVEATGTSDRSYLHAVLHIRNLVLNAKADVSSAHAVVAKRDTQLAEVRGILTRLRAGARNIPSDGIRNAYVALIDEAILGASR